MSTSPLIPTIKISDVSSSRATPFKTLGVVTKVETKPGNTPGMFRFNLTLRYNHPTSGREVEIYGGCNVRPEWFTQEFKAQVEATRDNKDKGLTGPLEDHELLMYDINVSNFVKGLFKAAGLDQIDLSEQSPIVGQVVGFKTKQRKDDPSRLDVSYFYAPKKA